MRTAQRHFHVGLLLIALPLVRPSTAASQHANGGTHESTGTAYTHTAPVARAVRVTETISIDGRLDEAVWASIPPITEFTQTDPFEGEPASQRTEVRIAYDSDAIYVGAMLFDSHPVSTRLARRDANVSDSDFFEILFDSYHDHQTAYRFSLNPSGLKRDAAVSGGFGGGDSSWDPVWDAATMITPDGWSLEMRIPFSQLRFSREEHQVWGLQIERMIRRNQESAVFSFTSKLERGGVPRFGHLEGISGIRPGRRLELLPYVGARAEYRQIPGRAGVDFANPFRSGQDYFTSMGLDLKYGITSNLTLDATVNPDFGQVEVDPAVINLTAFEIQFDEKRPFFIEGADIFRFGEGGPAGSTGRGPQLLYSRRIGRAPQGVLPSTTAFADAPPNTTILGAAKLTGKTANGWSVGVMEAVTNRESAAIVRLDGSRDDVVVEPMTNYFVGRLRREIGGNTTRLGLIGTAVNRQLDDPVLASRLRSAAYTAGVDFAHEFAGRTWRLSSTFTPSYVVGSREAIGRTQRSSARYFQRPDADHLAADPDATSLAGYYAMLDLNKQAGAFQAKVAVASASPGYEANDLGFQTAADRYILDTTFTYTQTRPGRTFRRWAINGGPDAIWNHGGDRLFAEFNLFGNFQLMNYWGGGWRVAYNPETYNDRLTRGGPLSRDPRGYSGSVNFSSDSRQSYVGRFGTSWAADEGGSWRHNADLNLTYRPRTNWDVRVGPSLSRSYSQAQYVTAFADPTASHTFGARYVFAGIHQTTLALETRVNVTFTPVLSFEMYAQPFLSSGEYSPLKELAGPGTFDFREYGTDVGTIDRGADGYFRVDPNGTGPAGTFRVPSLDFNHRSLLGNAVMRWEWRPGSTLFLVWQQSRAGRVTGMDADPLSQRVGNFDLSRDVRELFQFRPDNIFLIKMNFWFNP
jgi:hypothetical protein